MALENISDTARWVAVYRAMESERPDAIFRDAYARKLAGKRGDEIVNSMPRARSAAWAMIVRTAVMDELLLDLIANHSIDTVINLAAGLDARPWRLALPATLRWVDVDLPDILRYKSETIGNAKPNCRYEPVATDLTDPEARRTLLGRLADESKRAVILCEGLLIYLTPEQVGNLARDLHAAEKFEWWIIDLANPRLLAIMRRSWGHTANAANAPFKFAPAEGTKFFEEFGWRAKQNRLSLEEARRLHREMHFAGLMRFMTLFFPSKTRNQLRRMSSIVLLERTAR
ncbi:MAG: SAM-dependent methyltransferase [Gemmatimonadales bacterium]